MTFNELIYEEFNKLRIQFISYADILDADELEIALQYLRRLHEVYHPQHERKPCHDPIAVLK